jgi:hypothetical protein
MQRLDYAEAEESQNENRHTRAVFLRSRTSTECNTDRTDKMQQRIFSLQFKTKNNESTEVIVLPPSFDWK